MERNPDVIENRLIDAATVMAESSTMTVKMAALLFSVSFVNMMDLLLLHCEVSHLARCSLATKQLQRTTLERPVHPPNELDSELRRRLKASNLGERLSHAVV